MGAAGNLNYMQVADFFLGFAGIDIARDDGRHLGLWPWEQEPRMPSRAAVWLHENVFGEPSLPRAAYAARQAEHETLAAREPDSEPEPPAAVAPRPAVEPEPERAVPQRRTRGPGPARRVSKVEFCLRCGGRKYPAHAAEAAGGGSPHEHLSDEEKAWPGRWCVCWKRRARQTASAR